MLHFYPLVFQDKIQVVLDRKGATRVVIGHIDLSGAFIQDLDSIFLTDAEDAQLLLERRKVRDKYITGMSDPKDPQLAHTPTNPSHYKFTLDGKEYDIDQVIVALGLPWRLANAMKYIARAGKKDDEKQDVSKAITYCEKHINDLKK